VANNLLASNYDGKLLDDSNPQVLSFMQTSQGIKVTAKDKEIILQALTVITNAINTYVQDNNTRSYINLILGVVSQILLK
jgi:hypothetical protein